LAESKRSSSPAAFAAGAMLVSFTAPIVRFLAVPPTVTALYRMVSGGLMLVVLVALLRARVRFDRRAVLLAGLAGLAFALDIALWHRSIRLVGPGLATSLLGFQVFLMAAVGLATRAERLNWRLLVGVPLAFFGLYLILGAEWRQAVPGFRWGVVCGLGSAGFYTVYLLALRRLQHGADLRGRMVNMTLVSIACAAVLLFISLVQHESLAVPDLRSAGLLVLLGLIGQVVAWVLMSGGLPRMRHSLAGLLLLLHPLLTSVWDVLFFHRPTTALQAVGALITLGAIYLGTTSAGVPDQPATYREAA
jgi:drug/metabolite transporter (DMT)-like permease